MLGWALSFLIVAIIAAVFGFTGIAEAATDIARMLFFIFLVLFVLSLVFGLIRRRPASKPSIRIRPFCRQAYLLT